MTANLIITHDVDDVERYRSEYVPQVTPLLRKHGIDVVVGQFDATALEGGADSVIVLRAESEDALHAFYDDPDDDGPKAFRHSITSNVDALVVSAIAPPS